LIDVLAAVLIKRATNEEGSTMLELPPAQFSLVIPLFTPEQSNSTMIFATLEGRTPGKVYVDHADRPQQCLVVINFLNFTFMGGTVDQAWLTQSVNELCQTQKIMLNWTETVATTLQPPGEPAEIRGGLAFDQCRPVQPAPLPPGHTLRVIDRALLARCLWHEVMVLACGSTENFLAQGMGLCLLQGDEICSEAYAVWQGVGKFEIGIVTHEQHRQRGYAHLVCQHLIKWCEAQGYSPYWSCMQENVASAATARKLGFQKEQAYQWLVYDKQAATR